MIQVTPQSYESFKASIRTDLFLLIMFQKREINPVSLYNIQVLLNTWLGSETCFWIFHTLMQLKILIRFCASLKSQLTLENLKGAPGHVHNSARIALNVDSAMFGAVMFSWGFQYSGTQIIGMGNLQSRSWKPECSSRRNSKLQKQRLKYIENNSCFKFHNVNCRQCKCRTEKMEASNAELKKPGKDQLEN